MAGRDARERIILAAERLIAERGADVPLRDIAIAADQRNNSAVQYHFGSRDGLIDAVVEYRLAPQEARRLELLAEQEAAGTADDVRSLVEAIALPMLELPYRAGATHYARCLEQVRNHPAVADRTKLAGEQRAATRIITTRLDRALSDLPTGVRLRRLTSLPTVMFGLLADHERAVETGHVKAGDPRVGSEIIDMLTGMLTAPQLVKGKR